MKSQKTTSTQYTLSLLLSGKHPDAKKYAGKHVLIIADQVIPLKDRSKVIKDIEKLEKKYGATPTIAFIPSPGISYILIVCS